MPVFIPPCLPDRTANACAKAHGWPDPFSYNLQTGTVAPEGAIIGYGPSSFYERTSTGKHYVFSGVAGAMVGWTLID